MRKLAAIAGVTALLTFSSGQAFAFQETPPAPPSEDAEAAPQAPALQLGTPSAPQPDAKDEKGGLNLFGYTVLPKLNFGLDVLYGQDERQQQLQLGGTQNLDSLEQNDVSVLGKVKRRF
jgi:hypothetical protein